MLRPDWSAPDLRGLDIVFTVKAQAPSTVYSSPLTSPATGGINVIPTLNTPTIWVTDGLFPDQVRINWLDDYPANGTPQPDSYILQFQGEYDWGWTTITGNPIDAVESQTQYELWQPNAAGLDAPPSGKYRVRGFSQTSGYSAWSPEDYGYATDNALLAPNYGPSPHIADWWVTNQGDHWHLIVELGSPPTESVVPIYWSYRYWRGQWYSGSWTDYFDREEATRQHSTHYDMSYSNADTRRIYIDVDWTDPTDSSKTLTTTYMIQKTGFLQSLER